MSDEEETLMSLPRIYSDPKALRDGMMPPLDILQCAGELLMEEDRDHSWSSRISAAIARAEKWLDSPPPTRVLLGSGPYGEHDTRAEGDKHTIGRFEDENDAKVSTLGPDTVALAKALWSLTESGDCGQFPPDQALRDFTEKVESL